MNVFFPSFTFINKLLEFDFTRGIYRGNAETRETCVQTFHSKSAMTFINNQTRRTRNGHDRF